MKCEDWQERIFDLEGLEPSARQELEQHLLACAECSKWAKALNEVEVELKSQLQEEMNTPDLRPRILDRVAQERRIRWIATLPELMDALGWTAIGILAMAPLLLRSDWMAWIIAHQISGERQH